MEEFDDHHQANRSCDAGTWDRDCHWIGVIQFAADKSDRVRTGAGAYDKERYAQTFERLANELRRDAVSIEHIKLESSIEADSIADVHELRVRFIYFPEV